MAARPQSANRRPSAKQEPVAPNKQGLTIEGKEYEIRSKIEDNEIFLTCVVFSIPSKIPYLYKVYKHDGKDSLQSFKTTVQDKANELKKLFGMNVRVKDNGNEIGILTPLLCVGEDALYEYGSIIANDGISVTYEFFSIPDKTPYLYKVYTQGSKDSYPSFEAKVQDKATKLRNLLGEVQVVKLAARNQLGILMPRYSALNSDPIFIEGEEYRLDAHCLGEGNFGHVFPLKPVKSENLEKGPFALKIFKSFDYDQGEKEVENLAEFFDTKLFHFIGRNGFFRNGLLMPLFEGEPVLTFIDSRYPVLHPELPECSLSLLLSIAASLVQNALIEALPRVHRDCERIHGDLKTDNVLLKITREKDERTYFQVELIDGGEPAIGTPSIFGPETATWKGDKYRSTKERWSLKAEMYALSSVLATVLTASKNDPAHVLLLKQQAAKLSDTQNQPFCFDLMAITLRKMVRDEVKNFKTKEAKRESAALIQAIEEVIKNVEAMGSQEPEKRPDPFLVLRALMDAANLSLELEQVEKGIDLTSEPEPPTKVVSPKAVIPNRRHLLFQKPVEQQRPAISGQTANKIADNRKMIREATEAFSTYHQQTIHESTQLISGKFKGLLNRLKKINSPTSKAIVNLINSIKPLHTLEEVLSIIDKIEEVASNGINQAKARWFAFFYTGNMTVYQGILSNDLPLLRRQIGEIKGSIANNAEYQECLSQFKEGIRVLEGDNQKLLKGEAIPLPAAPHM